jgi:hypothetical protein
LPRPNVGVTAGTVATVGQRVGGAGVNDCDIAEQADEHVMRVQIPDRHLTHPLISRLSLSRNNRIETGVMAF